MLSGMPADELGRPLLTLALAEKWEAKTKERREAWQQHSEDILAARADPSAFMAFTHVDDETGDPIEQSWFHHELQEALSQHSKLVIHAQAGSGKTTQIAGRAVWELGKKPHMRILILSSSATLAHDILTDMKDLMTTNERVAMVFPDLRPKMQGGIRGMVAAMWRDGAIKVEGSRGKTPSVMADGVGGNIIGRRCDLIIIDDPHVLKTALTAHQRNKVIKSIREVVLSRLTPDGRVWMLSNAWHTDDAAFTFSRNPEFTHLTYPASKMLDPNRWTKEKLKATERAMGSVAYARLFECKPITSSTEVIPEADIRACILPGLRLQRDRLVRDSRGRLEKDQAGKVMEWEKLAVGLDPATIKPGQDEEAHDRYGLHVLGIHPETGRIRSLWMESGHKNTPDLLALLIEIQATFEPDLGIWVESNGQQQHLIDMARDQLTMQVRAKALGVPLETIEDLRICSHQTDGNKIDPNQGIPGMAVDFQGRAWELPDSTQEPAVEALVEGLLAFSFDGDHTADEVMAAWIARKALRYAPNPRISWA